MSHFLFKLFLILSAMVQLPLLGMQNSKHQGYSLQGVMQSTGNGLEKTGNFTGKAGLYVFGGGAVLYAGSYAGYYGCQLYKLYQYQQVASGNYHRAKASRRRDVQNAFLGTNATIGQRLPRVLTGMIADYDAPTKEEIVRQEDRELMLRGNAMHPDASPALARCSTGINGGFIAGLMGVGIYTLSWLPWCAGKMLKFGSSYANKKQN